MTAPKCEACIEAGQAYSVTDLGSQTTLLGHSSYWDEEGIHHNHDPNWITTGYRCSNGHTWTTKRRRPCGSCDYGGDADA